MRYRELGHLLRFETCQPVGKLLARNSGLNLFLSLSPSLPSSLVFLPRQLLGIGQSNFVIVEMELPMEKRASPNEFSANQRIPKTNLYYQNVFLSITSPELIGRAKFHYGIIALSKYLSRLPTVPR